jgi:hypothetical protein
MPILLADLLRRSLRQICRPSESAIGERMIVAQHANAGSGQTRKGKVPQRDGWKFSSARVITPTSLEVSPYQVDQVFCQLVRLGRVLLRGEKMQSDVILEYFGHKAIDPAAHVR